MLIVLEKKHGVQILPEVVCTSLKKNKKQKKKNINLSFSAQLWMNCRADWIL